MPRTGQLRPSARIAERQATKNEEGRVAEVRSFLSAMETHAEKLMAECQSLEAGSFDAQLADFKKFQNLASENLTFLFIIEKRLEEVEGKKKIDLEQRYDDLVVAVWSIVLTGSLSFMSAISEEDHLPIGTREVFVRELRTLNEAKQRLQQERYRLSLPAVAMNNCAKAESIISLVIQRAPSLLAFH